MANARRLALVVGSAACIWDDVRRAREIATFDAVCCVKRAGIDWPEPFQVWAGLHPEMMAAFQARRRALGLPDGYEVVSIPDSETNPEHRGRLGIDRRVSYRWKGMNGSAGSGIYGAKVMIESGFDVVLAGVPMDSQPHHVTHEKWGDGNWIGLHAFLPGFENALPHLRDRCKSMSGKTREILGEPCKAWLSERQQSYAGNPRS